MVKDWQKVEEAVRQYLHDLFGQEFLKRPVRLTEKLELGSGNAVEQFEFDAVSDDGRVVAEIKGLAHPEHPREMELAEQDVWRLVLANSERKLLFLVDPLFYQVFCRKNRNNLLLWRKKGVEIVSPFELSNYLEGLTS